MRTLFLLSFLLALPAGALAQGTTARTQAQKIFAEGEKAFAEKRHADALKAFEEAYLLDPVPVLLYNIGRAHEELSHFEEAGRFFQRYLDRVPNATDRPQVEQRLALLRNAAAAQADAEKARADADKARAEAELARADAEKARGENGEPNGVGGQTTVGGRDTLAWSLVGGGSVLLVTGVVLLTLASGNASEAEDLQPTQAGVDRFRELEDQTSTLQTMGWLGLGLGAAGAGAGLALLFLDNGAPADDAPLSLMAGPGGLVVGGRF